MRKEKFSKLAFSFNLITVRLVFRDKFEILMCGAQEHFTVTYF